jgi:hypothetical protein
MMIMASGVESRKLLTSSDESIAVAGGKSLMIEDSPTHAPPGYIRAITDLAVDGPEAQGDARAEDGPWVLSCQG